MYDINSVKIKRRRHEKNFFLFYWLFLNLGLSTVHIIFGEFLRNKFLQKTRLVFTANCISNRFGRGYNVTSQEEH